MLGDAASRNLTLARAHGMSQFSCCPKTGGGLTRRVVFGGLTNGWDQGMGCQRSGQYANDPACENRTLETIVTNNTLALPRDLSTAADGTLRQAFVPELQACRRQRTHLAGVTLDGSTGGRASPRFVEGAAGTQLEIAATFRLPSARPLSQGQCRPGLMLAPGGLATTTGCAIGNG